MSVDGTRSTVRPVAAGVPQESVLGPVLYLVYTNNLPVSLLSHALDAIYIADDTMYHYSSMVPGHASVVVQCQLDVLPEWLRKLRVAINTEKSETVYMQSKSAYQSLSLEGRQMSWEASMKYWGFRVGRR